MMKINKYTQSTSYNFRKLACNYSWNFSHVFYASFFKENCAQHGEFTRLKRLSAFHALEDLKPRFSIYYTFEMYMENLKQAPEET